MYAIRTLKRCGVSPRDLRSVFCYFVRPLVEYACPVWHSSLPQYLNDQVEQIQRRAVKIICPHLTYFEGLEELDLPTLSERRESLCKPIYLKNVLPSSKLAELLPEPAQPVYNVRYPRRIPLLKCRTNRFSSSFIPSSVRKWD